MAKIRGKNLFMEGLIAAGVRTIFGNPGTTELPLLDSLADTIDPEGGRCADCGRDLAPTLADDNF